MVACTGEETVTEMTRFELVTRSSLEEIPTIATLTREQTPDSIKLLLYQLSYISVKQAGQLGVEPRSNCNHRYAYARTVDTGGKPIASWPINLWYTYGESNPRFSG